MEIQVMGIQATEIQAECPANSQPTIANRIIE